MNRLPLLEIRNLTVGYGHVGVLENVSLGIEDGTIVALVGSNGAGKSTLLRAISGLLKPAHGTIQFSGQHLAGEMPNRVVDAGILHVAEGRRLFRIQSVRHNLDLGLYGVRLSQAEEKARLQYVLELFPILGERLDHQSSTLSGGQQQMLAIGQALMRKPKLLMLDEPSLGLAPIVVDQVMDVIVRLKSGGTTILLVEQMVERALEIADLAYVLQSGRLIGSGTPAELHQSDAIRRAYVGS